MSLPKAVYSSRDIEEKLFTVDPNNSRYQTTNGKTTGPSEWVLNAGQVDVDRPSDPRVKDDVSGELTYLSKLRTNLTGLQDDINEFLTDQMELAKKKRIKNEKREMQEQEKRIDDEINELLDGGDGEEEED
ncbi:hypothetical protein Kpol_2001p43 [Vanderwaltozyma polyspora DSM 70294]|uniref:EKC/KEOPS complex subunit GON7 n=1 Tax=Vanderwaltozyma polyspora (strain ATCC 22028 / DSM 70294 / BCRC 21397 / CBS 2163 / NBRC 10782 / NRRL Y-8283 / UCD 57-17) TaxID=436907 RepID=A7TGS5_VANPO|nr:uncharacterized protein Kpol_2001p43 [Vanderwaltozyma polyspora DSM 70294]EDO18538.1 hypothetical protein Kpol_2001p43 [Vanderwaltozyma polyspora DSM 70294]